MRNGVQSEGQKNEFSIFEKSGNFTWYKINRILLGSTCSRKLESDILRGHDTTRQKKRSFSIENQSYKIRFKFICTRETCANVCKAYALKFTDKSESKSIDRSYGRTDVPRVTWFVRQSLLSSFYRYEWNK